MIEEIMDTSNYLRDIIVDLTLRSSAYSSPASVYLALLTDLTSNGDTYVEVAGASYVRQSITFAAASGGVIRNSAAIEFPVPTTDWGTVTYVAIFDASTNGNMLFFGELSFPVSVFTDQVVNCPVDSLYVTISGTAAPFANTLLDKILRNQAYAATSGYLGMISSLSSSGSVYEEISGAGYARQAVVFAAPTDGQTENTGSADFPEATSDYPDTVSYFGLFNASVAGDLMFYDAITNIEVLSGQIVTVGSSEIDVAVS